MKNQQHLQNTFSKVFLKTLFSLFTAMFFMAITANAQSISGVVTDATGEGLVGASVVIKGTTTLERSPMWMAASLWTM